MKSASEAIETLTDRVEWYELEIERLKDVIREQDRRAKSTTARGEIRMCKGTPTFIVTCPAGDEYRLMRAVFAGFARHAFASLYGAFEALGGKDIHEEADRLFDTTEEEVGEEEGS